MCRRHRLDPFTSGLQMEKRTHHESVMRVLAVSVAAHAVTVPCERHRKVQVWSLWVNLKSSFFSFCHFGTK